MLLIQEPETNDWMPLHWGLPGGKPTKNESLFETFQRKSVTDIGQELNLKGLLKIEEIVTETKTILMLILHAEALSDQVKGEANEYRWVNKQDIEKMKTEEFTEYYNKKLLIDFFENKISAVPFSIIRSWDFTELSGTEEYETWVKSGEKLV